eukprot:4102484-Pyramimonas_sp.AAC.1
MVELKVGDGWQALIAEGLPQQFDDAIDECQCEFFDAAKKMSPEEPFDALPMSSPMTHKIEGCDLVARCPVDKWQRQGKKAFT